MIRASIASTLLGLALCGCSSDVLTPTPSWPAGTVLAIDDRPILAEEVDRWMEAIDLVEPGRSLAGRRRLALTNIELHRAIARVVYGDEVHTARDEAERLRELLLAGEPLPAEGPQLESREDGFWKHLGIDLWAHARTAPLGEWSPVIETTGAFVVMRVNSRSEEPWDAFSGAAVEWLVVPYVDFLNAREILISAEDTVQLTIVDEEWREILPAHYQYRMGVRPEAERHIPSTTGQ